MNGPAPRPCESCPYRRDVPSGIWDRSEYEKLRAYDEDTGSQPLGLFQCHQNDGDSEKARMCAGWVGVHGGELLALRLAAVTGAATPEAVQAAYAYVSPVPLFNSGNEAADHGQTEITAPSEDAQRAIDKITRTRKDVK